jgi:RNA exonuclease 1
MSLRLIFPTTAERAGRKDPSKYLLTVEQMVENDYPVPSYLADVFKAPEGWIETPEAPIDNKSEPESVYAIDCEMVRAFTILMSYTDEEKRLQCQTTDGKALTRICVIDYGTGKVVYDQLVKPPSPITDYLTRYVEEICPPSNLTTNTASPGSQKRRYNL